MTMQCPAKNKAELKAKLEQGCTIVEPTPWGEKLYRSNEVQVGFSHPVVLDHPRRMRFAEITKVSMSGEGAGGTWRVK